MVSKSIVRSILAVTLVFFTGTTAWATIGGTSTTQTSCTKAKRAAGLCSINVAGLLKGLGNVTLNPTAFAVTILIQKGTIVFRNPAGNSSNAEGVPFANVTVTLEGALPIDAALVSKNGKAIADVFFHDSELIAAIIAALQAQCNGGDQTACDTSDKLQKAVDQHPNWIQTVVVTKLQVLGKQLIDEPNTEPNTCDLNSDPMNIDATCSLEDALGSKCDAPPAVVANPKDFFWEAFTYACTESCHNKTGTVCPTTLPLP